MNTENDIKEFGFRHISINTVYNGSAGNGLPLPCVVSDIFTIILLRRNHLRRNIAA